ncbi:MAG: AbrB/MazE/SpoVT family DNA-binding domain-containing protein [Steroidobacteraceae bacterium]
MKARVRRIGNSLGVILPREILGRWQVGEGDSLELTEQGLHLLRRGSMTHAQLDDLRREMALAIVRRCEPRLIRAQILANLHRWRRQGVWVSAFDEWRAIAERGDDGELFAAMLGRDETAVRLRQSAPFAGLLPRSEVERLNEEAAA